MYVLNAHFHISNVTIILTWFVVAHAITFVVTNIFGANGVAILKKNLKLFIIKYWNLVLFHVDEHRILGSCHIIKSYNLITF